MALACFVENTTNMAAQWQFYSEKRDYICNEGGEEFIIV